MCAAAVMSAASNQPTAAAFSENRNCNESGLGGGTAHHFGLF
jgi:hypothetical protein